MSYEAREGTCGDGVEGLRRDSGNYVTLRYPEKKKKLLVRFSIRVKRLESRGSGAQPLSESESWLR